MLTSDHEHLSLLLANNNSNSNDEGGHNSCSPPHDLRHCRAASIGKDCLMVSWGRGDGWIVFYRRIVHPRQQQQQQQQQHEQGGQRQLEVGWQVVAAASPSKAVIHAATKTMSPSPFIHPEEESTEIMSEDRRLYDSGMLFVTDLMPMVVDNNNNNNNNNDVDSSQQPMDSDGRQYIPQVPSSAVLAVSRLGGYVELLPLADWIWQPHDSPHGTSPPRSAENVLPNLTSSSKTTAFATHDHHLDVLSLDGYRTNVDAASEWDEKKRADGPPAELILSACGLSADEEMENGDVRQARGKASVTLWAITATTT